MVYKIYSIFDSKVGAYMPPVMYRSKGEVLRALINTLRDDKSSFAKYPADFTLFELGEWDDNSCKYSLHSTPESVGVLLEFVPEVVNA